MEKRDKRPRPAGQPAVKTTIAVGRPPGSGKGVGQVPRGVEVLVKKASVHADFRAVLPAKRADAAQEIGLTLEPAGAMMLDAVTAAQPEAIIACTAVNTVSRAAFLRRAAVMLAALGADLVVGGGSARAVGIAPDHPRRDRYVLYTETDYKGEMTIGLVEEPEFDRKAAEVARKNRVLRQAYVAASKAWSQDEARKGVPFPMRAPLLLRLDRIATYSQKDRAEEAFAKRQEQADRKAEDAKKLEERRVASLSEAARAKEKEKADLLKAAEALFEKELAALLGSPKPE